LNQSVFNVIYDTTYLSADAVMTGYLPFRYSFDDPLGKQDWSNMFVTKLLATHQGNCHSLAYLYKILADELGAKCWLALAPNHIYIKNYSEKNRMVQYRTYKRHISNRRMGNGYRLCKS
jgi:hypothetical protein